MLTAADDGIGVAASDLPRLFERFWRADAARASRGTGLGLAIVKHVVTAAGGTVEARGDRGRGLEVRCVFSAAAQETTRGACDVEYTSLRTIFPSRSGKTSTPSHSIRVPSGARRGRRPLADREVVGGVEPPAAEAQRRPALEDAADVSPHRVGALGPLARGVVLEDDVVGVERSRARRGPGGSRPRCRPSISCRVVVAHARIVRSPNE